ncbi:uncharacterized protein LOC135832989 [Planococcus citri]|uniref:uncharacterized protein LOC135832989 n=1 Tax=Planococcus citri TaxID=170843 RepID=UPI0031F944B5
MFKKQKEEYPGLKADDFVLIMQTKFQRKMLQKFGSQMVTINGTHGTNKYKFQLYTLLVLDEWNEGIPVAFCISNREDEQIFRIFFEKIKEAAGIVSTEIFMSDDAPAFINAWEKVMGMPKRRLLCLWHVHRNWTLNQSKINNPKKQKLIMTLLRSMSEELDEEKFKREYEHMLSQLHEDEETVEFALYLQRQYSNKVNAWARCFRKHVPAHTNMHLESLHRAMKYYYMDGQTCIRLDESIDALLNIIRDKKFDRLRKFCKNTPYKKQKQTEERHIRSIDFLNATETKINMHEDENSWIVNDKYVVTRIPDVPHICCRRTCEKCAICIHMYSCNCIDNSISYFICKHIHACVMRYTVPTNLEIALPIPEVDVEIGYETDIPRTIYRNEDTYDLEKEMNLKNDLIQGFIQTRKLGGSEDYKTMIKLQDKMIALYQSMDKPKCVDKTTKVQKQSFFPTRKCTKKSKPTTSLPYVSNEHRQILQNGLLRGEEEAVNVHVDNDHEYYIAVSASADQ